MRRSIRSQNRRDLRSEIGLGLVLAVAMTLSSNGARADEWCGYASHDNAVIECGYTTAADCETAVGKGGMCFVDPDTALNIRRFAPRRAIHFISSKG